MAFSFAWNAKKKPMPQLLKKRHRLSGSCRSLLQWIRILARSEFFGRPDNIDLIGRLNGFYIESHQQASLIMLSQHLASLRTVLRKSFVRTGSGSSVFSDQTFRSRPLQENASFRSCFEERLYWDRFVFLFSFILLFVQILIFISLSRVPMPFNGMAITVEHQQV